MEEVVVGDIELSTSDRSTGRRCSIQVANYCECDAVSSRDSSGRQPTDQAPATYSTISEETTA